MKKMLSLSLALLTILALSACGTDAPSNSSVSSPADTSSVSSSAPAGSASTEPAEAPSSAPYEITYTNFTTYSDSIGTIWGQSIIEITNTGSNDLYLSTGSYDIKDENGSLVATESLVSFYPDVLQPGEKGYMYDENTFDDLSADETYTITPHISVEDASIACVRYDVFDTTLKNDDYNGVTLIGQLTNTTDEDGSMVYVVAVLYDEADTPLGILYTIMTNDVPAGETMGFEASGFSLPPTVSADAIANYTIYAYPLQMQF